MPVTIDGTTGVTTPGATVGAITGILKATSGVVSQAVAGTDYLTSTSGGAITLATAQTASGTAVDFTGIPSWVKRITVMFNKVGTNGSSVIRLQLGDAGGIETTGYAGSKYAISPGNTGLGSLWNTSGAEIVDGNVMNNLSELAGIVYITLVGSNLWLFSGSTANTTSGNGATVTNGTKNLSDTLTQLRITTVNGTDTFDAGTINISYE
jgi:hypothetical protein